MVCLTFLLLKIILKIDKNKFTSIFLTEQNTENIKYLIQLYLGHTLKISLDFFPLALSLICYKHRLYIIYYIDSFVISMAVSLIISYQNEYFGME